MIQQCRIDFPLLPIPHTDIHGPSPQGHRSPKEKNKSQKNKSEITPIRRAPRAPSLAPPKPPNTRRSLLRETVTDTDAALPLQMLGCVTN